MRRNTPLAKNTEGAIWRRLIEPRRSPLSHEAAESLLALRFAGDDLRSMHDLAAMNGAGGMTPAEQEELRCYVRVGDVLALLQSKARQAPKRRGKQAGHG